jgi:hypothetical protein
MVVLVHLLELVLLLALELVVHLRHLLVLLPTDLAVLQYPRVESRLYG